MTDLATHPGRSPEFLSRLHDGDLTAAERAQFEAHRAHCAECRNAASEFEAALALYRSARPHPPAPDLSARILRKLQAANPRRSPLGVTFGIDLRWAGAFVAALLAVIIGSSVIARREASERKLARDVAPIPVVMEPNKESPPQTAPTSGPPEARRDAPRSLSVRPPNIAEERQAGGSISTGPSRAAANKVQPPAASLEKDASARGEDGENAQSRLSEPKTQPLPAAPRKSESSGSFARAPEPAGGEGGLSSKLTLDSLNARMRLDISPMDEAGSAPSLLNEEEVNLPADLRGRDFRLVVEADGRVREVRPVESGPRKKALLRQEPAPADAAAADSKAPQSLMQLRFRPGDRPRILRAHIE